MNKSELPINPYNHGHPVKDLEQLIGRKSECDTIDYYLNLHTQGSTVHLAFTGERAAGKTSLLNYVEQKADTIGFTVTKYALTESDSDPRRLLLRILDKVIRATFKNGYLGGNTGETARQYRRFMSGQSDELDLISYPSLIGRANGSAQDLLADDVFMDDLISIAQEASQMAQKDIKYVIILDEGDVLARDRSSLQLLRNIFTELEGFLLVIAGTQDLFRVFDEVFSPISRHFIKIQVGPFRSSDDTEECLTKPLVRLGLDVGKICEDEGWLGWQVHRLTGGKPYEIQLICHLMYKRMEMGLEDGMTLNQAVIHAAIGERFTASTHIDDGLIQSYKELTSSQLRTLASIKAAQSNVECIKVYSLLEGESSQSGAEIDVNLRSLSQMGIIRENDHAEYELMGDTYHEFYLRYVASAQDIPFPLYATSLNDQLGWYITHTSSSVLNDYYPGPAEVPDYVDKNAIVQTFSKAIEGTASGTLASSRWWSDRAKAIFIEGLVESATSESTSANFALVHAEVLGKRARLLFSLIAGEGVAEAFKQDLEALSTSMEEFDSRLEIQDIAVAVPVGTSVPDLAKLVPSAFRPTLASALSSRGHEHFEGGDYELAMQKFLVAANLSTGIEYYVNVLFVSIVSGQLDTAREILTSIEGGRSKALHDTERSDWTTFQLALLNYDVAYIEYKNGNWPESLRLLEENERPDMQSEGHTAVLIVPDSWDATDIVVEDGANVYTYSASAASVVSNALSGVAASAANRQEESEVD